MDIAPQEGQRRVIVPMEMAGDSNPIINSEVLTLIH